MKSLSDWKKYLHSQTLNFLSSDLMVSLLPTWNSYSTKIEDVLNDEELRNKLLDFLRGSFNVLLDMTIFEEKLTWKFILTFEDLYLLVLEEMDILPRKGTSQRLQRTLSGSLRNSPFVHRETEPEISTILPGHLFLSSYLGASNASSLKNLNIRYIINCAIECSNHHPSDFIYANLNLKDNREESVLDTFDQAFEIIEKARQEGCGVLVHCYAGISRSSSIVIGYLMKIQNLRLNAAYQLTQCRRPIIAPNASYKMQLARYEEVLFNLEVDMCNS